MSVILLGAVIALASCSKDAADAFANSLRSPASLADSKKFSNAPVRALLAWSFKNKKPVSFDMEGIPTFVQALEDPTDAGCRVKFTTGAARDHEMVYEREELDIVVPRGTYGAAIPSLFFHAPPERVVTLHMNGGSRPRGQIFGYDADGNLHWLPEGGAKPETLDRGRINLARTVEALRMEVIPRVPYAREVLVAGGKAGRIDDGVTPGGRYSASSDIGRGEQYRFNGDAFFALEQDGIVFLGVVDGVGLVKDAPIASDIVAQNAIRAVRAGYFNPSLFKFGTKELLKAVNERRMRAEGAAVAAVIRIEGDQMRPSHAGDVRAAVVRNDKTIFVTKDHPPTGKRIDIQDFEAELGPPTQLESGDWVVLASDGFWKNMDVSKRSLADVLKGATTPADAQNRLQAIFSAGPHDDNVTIVVYRHGR